MTTMSAPAVTETPCTPVNCRTIRGEMDLTVCRCGALVCDQHLERHAQTCDDMAALLQEALEADAPW
jgi:hypothetical protein